VEEEVEEGVRKGAGAGAGAGVGAGARKSRQARTDFTFPGSLKESAFLDVLSPTTFPSQY